MLPISELVSVGVATPPEASDREKDTDFDLPFSLPTVDLDLKVGTAVNKMNMFALYENKYRGYYSMK